MSDDVNFLPKGYALQEFIIESVLGQGGFGVSYLAYDEYLGLKVVLKEYLPAQIAKRTAGSTVVPLTDKSKDDYLWGLTRFQEEAQTLAKLQHNNIVTVKRVFPANGTAYMVMDYLAGGSLEDRFRAGPMTEGVFLPILESLIKGLDYVHAQNFMHRDIAPDNIMFSDKGEPVLIDFGAARQQIEGKSKPISAIVKEGYAPLEQYNEHSPQGPYTDIYALAAVCYEAVTGQRPPASTVRIDADDDPMQSLVGRYPNWSESFLKAIEAGLQIRRQDRPQTLTDWQKMFKASEDNDREERMIQMIKNAWADGVITPEERQTLYLAADAFGFTKAYVDAGIDAYAPRNMPQPPPPPPSGHSYGGPGGQVPPSVHTGYALPQKKNNTLLYIVIMVLLLGGIGFGYTQYEISQEEKRRDIAAYNRAVKDNSERSYKKYMDDNPTGIKYTDAARNYNRLKAEREMREADDRAFATAKNLGTIKALQDYLANKNYSRHHSAARTEIQRLRDLANKYSEGNMIREARAKKTFVAYKAYVDRHPNGPNIAEAYSEMGRCKRDGVCGVSSNYNEARGYLQIAADKGYSYAAKRLAYMYREGLGGSKDTYGGYRYYKFCADKGDKECMYQLGYMSEKGIGTSQSRSTALYWYKKSAALGYSFSKSAIKRLEDAANQYSETNMIKSARSKNTFAAYQAYVNRHPNGSNVAEAYSKMGQYKRDGGGGTSTNQYDARRYFKIAADKGWSYAAKRLAYMYKEGLGGGKDSYAGFRYYKICADKNDRECMYQTGYHYHYGIGTSQSNLNALRYYKKAKDKGYGVSTSTYNSLRKTVLDLYTKLADDYYSGRNGKSKNLNLARSYYAIGAEFDDSFSVMRYGYMLDQGLGGSKDQKAAFKWFVRGKDLGQAMATFNLGVYYYNGTTVTRNYDTARGYFLTAAGKGNNNARNLLGVIYENGYGSATKNYTTAFNWYLQAANDGYKPAMRNLASLYRAGKGVSKNTTRAKYWEDKAR